MKKFLICIGNRFVGHDSGGLAVYDFLKKSQSLPEGIELIEGGLAGLNLLPFLEQGGRVVFVDAVHGFTSPGESVILDRQEILQSSPAPHYDHEAGLAYLLAILPHVCEGEMPEEIALVGLEGECEQVVIERAARQSLRIVSQGMRALR